MKSVTVKHNGKIIFKAITINRKAGFYEVTLMNWARDTVVEIRDHKNRLIKFEKDMNR